MRAVLCRAFGPPESLTVEELPDPVAGPGEVVVDVACRGAELLRHADHREQVPVQAPAAVLAGGGVRRARCRRWAKASDPSWLGARVAAYVGWGACRTRLAVPVEKLVRMPDGLSDEAAAGLSVTYGTTLHALADRARLQPGETLAVLGAAGGVGLAAVEIGKLMGARVIACASSRRKAGAGPRAWRGRGAAITPPRT